MIAGIRFLSYLKPPNKRAQATWARLRKVAILARDLGRLVIAQAPNPCRSAYLMQNNHPVWEHGLRCRYWLGIEQVGFVGLTMSIIKPVVYTLSFNFPYYT